MILYFLGSDGLRTIAGTARIGDVELGTISSNVQSLFDANLSSSGSLHQSLYQTKHSTEYFLLKVDKVAENSNKRHYMCS